jgi:predicted Zn-dependent peptidase
MSQLRAIDILKKAYADKCLEVEFEIPYYGRVKMAAPDMFAISEEQEEIKETKLKGVAQINIDKVKAEQTRSLENDVKENSYWRYRLEQAIFRGSDPNKILQAPARINLIDVATTKALANKYFNEANKAKFVLLPE